MTGQLTINTRPMAFNAPVISHMAPGLTVARIVEKQISGTTIGALQVELNGDPLPRDQWETFVPAAKDHLLIYTTLQGGGGGKNPMRTILSLVVIAAATWVTAGAGGAAIFAQGGALAAGGMGSTLAGMAVATVGMYAINSAFPISTSSISGGTSAARKSVYSLSGSSNVADPWGPVPVLLGRHKVYPRLGAKPYTQIVGHDEFLYLLLIWGHGPLNIGQIKIGDTPISSFDDVTVQTYRGYANDPRPSLFPGQVTQIQVGAKLTHATGWVTRTAPAGVDVISIDTYFQGGIVHINSAGKRLNRTIQLRTRYREIGTTAWNYLDESVSYDSVTGLLGLASVYQGFDGDSRNSFTVGLTNSIFASTDGRVYTWSGTASRSPDLKIGEFTLADDTEYPSDETNYTVVYTVAVTSVTNIASTRKTGLVCSLSGGNINVTSGTVAFPTEIYTAKTLDTLRYTSRIRVDRSKNYEVARYRMTGDSVSTATDSYSDEATWSSLRGQLNRPPMAYEKPVAVSAIRIKASEQLSGVVDNVNAVCQCYAPTWSGTAWNGGWKLTSNPAALYRLVLMGSGSAKARTAAQVYSTELGAWYTECVSKGYEFNQWRDYTSSMWDVLQDIAAAGYASPSLSDGVWSIIQDTFSKSVAQHITPRNSWGFSSEKTLIDFPHAMRVKFINEDNDWNEDERIVYADGYNATTATLFEQIEFPGVTDKALVYKRARYLMAHALLRPEVYTTNMDFERLGCRRGSLVYFAHDVPMFGSMTARVKSLTFDMEDFLIDHLGNQVLDENGDPIQTSANNVTAITLDTKVTMESDKLYACRFRRNDLADICLSVSTVAGESETLTLATAVPAVDCPQVGDLAMFGEADREAVLAVVKKIESHGDFSARISLVDYAPSIANAYAGPIPAFETQITNPADITRIAPAVPMITAVDSSTNALERIGNTVRPRIMVTIAPIEGNVPAAQIKLRYKIDGDTAWKRIVVESAGGADIYITPVIEGETYTIQARSVSPYGAQSAWTKAVTETVRGESTYPANVSGFACNIVAGSALLTWDANLDVDLSHYKIRWSPATSGASWAESVAVVERVGRDSTSITVAANVGTYLIKAVDLSGRESVTAAVAITSIARVAGMNLALTFAQTDPTWSGTGSNVEASAELGGLVITDLETAETGTYEFDGYSDLEGVFTSRLTASLYVSGQDLGSDLYEITDLYEVANLYGADDGQYNIALELATTEDDPAGTPTWSAWKPFVVGDYTARAFKFRAAFTGLAPTVTPILESISISIDMPDRVAPFSESVGTGGASIAFSPAFFDVPVVGLSVLNGAEGDKYTITNLDEDGFDIAFTNGGSPVARNISGIARGYGELET